MKAARQYDNGNKNKRVSLTRQRIDRKRRGEREGEREGKRKGREEERENKERQREH